MWYKSNKFPKSIYSFPARRTSTPSPEIYFSHGSSSIAHTRANEDSVQEDCKINVHAQSTSSLNNLSRNIYCTSGATSQYDSSYNVHSDMINQNGLKGDEDQSDNTFNKSVLSDIIDQHELKGNGEPPAKNVSDFNKTSNSNVNINMINQTELISNSDLPVVEKNTVCRNGLDINNDYSSSSLNKNDLQSNIKVYSIKTEEKYKQIPIRFRDPSPLKFPKPRKKGLNTFEEDTRTRWERWQDMVFFADQISSEEEKNLYPHDTPKWVRKQDPVTHCPYLTEEQIMNRLKLKKLIDLQNKRNNCNTDYISKLNSNHSNELQGDQLIPGSNLIETVSTLDNITHSEDPDSFIPNHDSSDYDLFSDKDDLPKMGYDVEDIYTIGLYNLRLNELNSAEKTEISKITQNIPKEVKVNLNDTLVNSLPYIFNTVEGIENTSPSLITIRARRRSEMSWSGLPSTISISANAPPRRVPISPCIASAAAGTDVAVFSASTSVSPPHT